MKKDYSEIRGFCYSAGYRVPEEQLKRELGYAKSLNLDSARIWLDPADYRKDRKAFLAKLQRFVETAWEFGISTMPILFNGNGMDPSLPEPSSWEEEDGYVKDVVELLKDEPGLIIWDIMNEPSCNDYILKSPAEERERRWDKMTAFLEHHSEKIHELAPDNARTIGHTYIQDVKDTLDAVDVISFHDYFSTKAQISATYEEATKLAKSSGKQIINSEMCCLGRANPYDLALQKCREYHAGFYVFELMIHGYWGDVHGIFYPDGTVRDPSIPAAILGFYRNRSETAVPANANKEGYAEKGIEMVKEALKENTEVFHASSQSIEVVLEAAEFCANLLEGCELVPMHNPPTAQIEKIRKDQDGAAARKLAYDLAEILKRECLLL